ncbi:hypothetical protein A2671_00075 [Candidatus Kaiserbacteria bacterium RIFCSPHIGHO2_01_FULL_49_13]|uniref:Uncharacterized protein n=1 Tax=Candidatus Kaiserbacteria bacterium RIFCSPHIGHO2_01_FULL_49_13 TaxID=1798477 RepID=A0A1F6CE85_9BACT|nr:MAG: hypothetical protein A2671_00075 [Candidatus Kaiserbacteria bacterium RIFCSPHIGHO2_01_FULL_49_13]
MSRKFIFPLIVIGAILAAAGVWYAVAYEVFEGKVKYLNLQEFAVRLHIPPELKQIRYETREVESIGPMLFVSDASLEDDTCVLGVFFKINKAEVRSGAKWNREALERAMVLENDRLPQVKEFTDFYLVFEPSQTACASDASDGELEKSHRALLWQSLTTAEYLS